MSRLCKAIWTKSTFSFMVPEHFDYVLLKMILISFQQFDFEQKICYKLIWCFCYDKDLKTLILAGLGFFSLSKVLSASF